MVKLLTVQARPTEAAPRYRKLSLRKPGALFGVFLRESRTALLNLQEAWVTTLYSPSHHKASHSDRKSCKRTLAS